MKLTLTVYDALCETRTFNINGIGADYEDFGVKDDMDKNNAEDYGCGDMRFTRKASRVEILNKYKISQKEYDKICDKLEEKLSFGGCGWCI